MKNVIIVFFALVSTSAFAQTGMPTIPTDQVNAAANQANTKIADTNAKAADANAKATAQATDTKKSMADKMMVNVNTATPDQLAKLPGIGPKKAQAIVAARPFTNAQDLLKVKGIKEATVNKIKDKISF